MSHLFAFLIGCVFTPIAFFIYAIYTSNVCFDGLLCDYDDCEENGLETKNNRTPLNHEALSQLERECLPTPEELSLW